MTHDTMIVSPSIVMSIDNNIDVKLEYTVFWDL